LLGIIRIKTEDQSSIKQEQVEQNEFQEDEESFKNAELMTKNLPSKINSKETYQPNQLPLII